MKITYIFREFLVLLLCHANALRQIAASAVFHHNAQCFLIEEVIDVGDNARVIEIHQ
jgi:hypothetical protein